jgi:hypothetical protein
MSDKPILCAEVQKNAIEAIKVHLQKWHESLYVDIRVWATPKPSGDDPGLHPTRKGITFLAELLPDMIQALEETERLIEKGEEREEVTDGAGGIR